MTSLAAAAGGGRAPAETRAPLRTRCAHRGAAGERPLPGGRRLRGRAAGAGAEAAGRRRARGKVAGSPGPSFLPRTAPSRRETNPHKPSAPDSGRPVSDRLPLGGPAAGSGPTSRLNTISRLCPSLLCARKPVREPRPSGRVAGSPRCAPSLPCACRDAPSPERLPPASTPMVCGTAWEANVNSQKD